MPKAVSKGLWTSFFEQLFRVLVGLGGPRIRVSGGGRSWAGLGRRGRFWSDFGRHLGPILGSKIGLGTPQERSVDRFYPPGGYPGGSRRGSGRSFWGLFCGWVGGNEKKAPKVPINTELSSICCMRFLTASVCILCASALASAKAQLKKLLKIIGFCSGICVCAICARSATILQTERKSNNITVKKPYKKHSVAEASNKIKKVPF